LTKAENGKTYSDLVYKKKVEKLCLRTAIDWIAQKQREFYFRDRKKFDNHFYPWELFYFAHHVLRYAKGKSKNIHNVFAYFHNHYRELPDPNMIDGKLDVFKFFYVTAFQQFGLQKGMDGLKSKIARQRYFLKALEKEYSRILGFEAVAYNEISFFIWSILRGDARQNFIFGPKNFEIFYEKYGEEAVVKYLEVTSSSISELKKSIQKIEDYRDFTPFYKSPLTVIDGQHWCLSPHLFDYLMSDFTYDLIRDPKNHPNGPAMFGRVFDEYCEKRLSGVFGEDYINEKELIKLVGKRSKVVDGVVSEDKKTPIYIEYKACQTPKFLRLEPSPAEFIRNFSKTIIKAVAQGYHTHQVLTEKKVVAGEFRLIIVTYKDMFLGSGESSWAEFLEVGLNTLHPEIPTKDINPANIFFIDIDSLDHLMTVIKKTTLVTLLQRIQDRFKAHKLFHVAQVIPSLINEFGRTNLADLDELFDETVNACISLIKDD
jgi:hypothetical protein